LKFLQRFVIDSVSVLADIFCIFNSMILKPCECYLSLPDVGKMRLHKIFFPGSRSKLSKFVSLLTF